MIPTPDYLKQYSSEQTQKGNRLSFKLKCSCGCESFAVFEKSYTSDEKRLIKEYEDRIPNTGWHSIYTESDSGGNIRQYIKILGIFKKYVTFPQVPVFMKFNAVKAICSKCQKEIVLFDSRYDGYDGMTTDDEEAKRYTPSFKQRGQKPYSITVTVENEPSPEAFVESTGEQCTYEFYSNAFSYIRICGRDDNGKEKLLYDFETA